MSYTNPQQHVYSDAQHFQRLQDSLSSNAARISQFVIATQQQRKKDLADRTKEIKRLQEESDDRVAGIASKMAKVKIENPKVDYGPAFNPIVKEYISLSEQVGLSAEINYAGRTYTSSQAKIRMGEIEGTVDGVKGSIENMTSFTEGSIEKMNNAGNAGGYYQGGDPNNWHAVKILQGVLPGSSRPIFKDYETDGSIDKFIWGFYDENDKLVAEMSQQQLENLDQNNSELLTTIPDETNTYNKLRTTLTGVFTEGDKNNKGELVPNSQKIQTAYLTAYGPNNKLIDSNLEKVTLDNYSKDPSEKWVQSYSKVNKNAMHQDPGINAEIMSDANAVLKGDLDTSSAMALHNTFFQNVDYKAEYFLNNESILDENGNKYTNEKDLPTEIKVAIQGSRERAEGKKETDGTKGYIFPDDRALTKEEQNIFKVAYKSNYIKTQIPDRQAVGGPVEVSIKDDDINKEKWQTDIANTKLRLETLVPKLKKFDLKGQTTISDEGSETGKQKISFNAGFVNKLKRLGFATSEIKSDDKIGDVVKVTSIKSGKSDEISSKGLTTLALRQLLYILDGGELSDPAYEELGDPWAKYRSQ